MKKSVSFGIIFTINLVLFSQNNVKVFQLKYHKISAYSIPNNSCHYSNFLYYDSTTNDNIIILDKIIKNSFFSNLHYSVDSVNEEKMRILAYLNEDSISKPNSKLFSVELISDSNNLKLSELRFVKISTEKFKINYSDTSLLQNYLNKKQYDSFFKTLDDMLNDLFLDYIFDEPEYVLFFEKLKHKFSHLNEGLYGEYVIYMESLRELIKTEK